MPETLQIGDRLDVAIERLSFTGKGIGRVNNFVIFIPHTIPGDVVKAEITSRKKRYADARAVDFVSRSSDSIEPRCRHFGICGGCSFQNLPYELQLEAKQDAVQEHIRRIGKIEQPPIDKIIPSDKQLFYRNKMEFSFKPDQEDFLKLGLHYRGEWEKIFDVEECLLQSEISNRIVNRVRDFFKAKRIPAYHLSEHHGHLRFLIIRESLATGEVMLILVTNRGDYEYLDDFVEMVTSEFPRVTSVVHVINSKKANIAVGESEKIIRGNEHITEYIGGNKFLIRPSSFFQTNSRQTEILYNRAAEMGELGSDEKVLDLYTGCGTIAIHIARNVGSVLGIELNPDAVVSANENARLNEINNCEFVAGDVRKTMDKLIDEGRKFDTIIADPPRAGIGHKSLVRIFQLQPEKLIYISCNPATLAADIRELRENGYRLDRTVPVDMFPHTFHIETVSRITRK
mgnify:CR=1 FL=1